MTTEEFVIVFGNYELRMGIKEEAERMFRSEKRRQRAIQEAWLAVSLVPGHWSESAYLELAVQAMTGLWREQKAAFVSRGEYRGPPRCMRVTNEYKRLKRDEGVDHVKRMGKKEDRGKGEEPSVIDQSNALEEGNRRQAETL